MVHSNRMMTLSNFIFAAFVVIAFLTVWAAYPQNIE